MPLLGAHMSIAGHPYRALLRGKEAGCRVIQIFTRNRLKWAAKSLTRSEADYFYRAREETAVIPVAIHGSYLMNLASPQSDVREKSLSLLMKEMDWAEMLQIPYLVLHPGSHMGDGEERGLERVAAILNRAIEDSSGYRVKILLETTAGQGTGLGYRFEHLADILKSTGFSKRLGVCFDTCHVFAAGYDFRTREAYGQIMENFDNIIGLDRLKLFHVNDSKTGPGSRVDRHDHPGKGLIGLEPFSFFLNDLLFSGHPFLLETPKGKDENGIDLDRVNLKRLEGIIGKERKNDCI